MQDPIVKLVVCASAVICFLIGVDIALGFWIRSLLRKIERKDGERHDLLHARLTSLPEHTRMEVVGRIAAPRGQFQDYLLVRDPMMDTTYLVRCKEDPSTVFQRIGDQLLPWG